MLRGTTRRPQSVTLREELYTFLMRAVVWLHILIVLCLLGYSTYCLFQGDFEQALVPYPMLVLYYFLIVRSKTKNRPPTESRDHGMKD